MNEIFAHFILFVYTIRKDRDFRLNATAIATATAAIAQPHYARVKSIVRERIASGALRPGDAVPSEEALARELGLSRLTVHRGLHELMQEGLLVRFRRRGTFVADLQPQSSPITVEPIDRQIAARGHAYAADVLDVTEERAGADVAARLELPAGTKVFRSRVVHLEDGVPIQFEDRYVNPRVVPEYRRVDFAATPPAQYLQDHYPLREVEHAIMAESADPESARCLRVEPGTPCLTIHRRTWSQGRVASYARLVHPGGRYRLFSRFRPG